MNELDCSDLVEKFMNSVPGTVLSKEKKKKSVVRDPTRKEEIQLVIPTFPEEKYVCKKSTWNPDFYQKLEKIREMPMKYRFSHDSDFVYITKNL
jgi:hypothetical protein